MSLLFIYDMTMYEKNNKFYNYMFSPSLLKEYKKLDENISICCNYEKCNTEHKMNCIPAEDFNQVKLIPFNIKNIFNYTKSNIKILEKKIKLADKIIIRSPSFISFLAIDLCNKYNKDYLVELVGCPFDAFWNHSLEGKIISIPFYIKTKKVIKKSKNVVYVTNNFLQKRYPTDGVAYSCSDVELPSNDMKIREIKENQKIKICTIASLDVKYKGQEYVIKALAALNNPKIEYHLIGQGEGKKIRKLIKKYSLQNNVKLIGSLSHDDVLKYLSKMDIYIHPSLTEGLPRTVMEAMSLGLPVTGTEVGGIPELVSDKLTFKKRSVYSIIDRINFLLNPTNYKNESQRSLIEIKKYEYSLLKKKKKQIYQEVFKER